MSKFEIFKSTIPVMLGYIPLGIAFGIYGISQGLEFWVMMITSLLVYAGSVEFVLVAFIVTGASLIDTFIISFLLNFRHFFYTMSLIDELRAIPRKIYPIYALTDETFALLKTRVFLSDDERKNGISEQRARELGLIYNLTAVFNHSYWISGVAIGSILGASLNVDFSGVEFSLVALFAMLSYEMFKSNPQHKILIFSLICAFAGLFVFPVKYYLFGTLLCAIFALLAFRKFFERG
ncbi:AzlC family ABC transporter permease [Campylobacter sp. VBCF_06 NA8]|uniref:AzlC family ABC transporter permease n=1 Tax=Campylobacter sp. VBCF_06 NA8 TaxID=2983822 RepID=UPI0022E9D303|nr:AzlC family ABC transporter permease [Campylobacter sp. VBCF_06 NA8]MDA3046058.1 AzlC family ABC transporter permease [Campylobacter sp. VBCF_06 NA8]